MAAVGVGDKAPPFTLPGVVSGAPQANFSLADFAGRPVVLVFYPGDDTVVCTKQLCSYSENLTQFSGVGAEVVAISPQGVESHVAFAAKHKLTMPLLADIDKTVNDLYGTLGPLGFVRRSVFVVDGSGVIRYAHRAIAGLTFRSVDELTTAVRSIAS